MKKPEHMTQHEWDESLRQAQADLEYRIYHSPAYVDKLSRVFAILIIAALVAMIVGAAVATIVYMFKG